jgi:hypothetical protein
MLFRTFTTKLPILNKLSNKRFYCNVNKSDLNLIEQKINTVDEKINTLHNKLDFVFYLSIISSVTSIIIKAFEN